MTLPTFTDIDALLAFLPGFRERDRRFVRTGPSSANSWGYRYEPDVYAFFGVAGAECWMDHDYDPQRATTLLKDSRAIADADLLTLRTLMTACVRGEKFCDGWWASILQDGTLLAVLERLEAIRGPAYLVREPETVESLFAQWRACASPRMHWGLAWYLSNEICRRYYCSHGIAPFLINHGGTLGYYGMEISQLPCQRQPTGQKEHVVVGRITMTGDVENWITGSPGDHGRALKGSCTGGASTKDLVTEAIRHLGLPALPAQPHNPCHHKRRGDSFVLLWEIATLLALRVDLGRSEAHLLANGLKDGKPFMGLDGPPMTYRKPGHFWFGRGRGVYVTDEGVLCDGSGENLWERYMVGESPAALAEWLRDRIESNDDP